MSIVGTVRGSGSEALLIKAVECDKNGKYPEALANYQAGIERLMTVLKGIEDPKVRDPLRARIGEYMTRAEEIRKYVDKQKEEGKYHKELQIENNSSGYSYPVIFGEYIDPTLTEVTVEDPYIRSTHKIYNFLRFCEMLITSDANVKRIHLVTSQDEKLGGSAESQMLGLRQLSESLRLRGIDLTIEYSSTLHDRQIRFDNGWIIKIGRGLDYFKATDNKFSIGFCDMSLRKCYETTVNIFHSKHTQSNGPT